MNSDGKTSNQVEEDAFFKPDPAQDSPTEVHLDEPPLEHQAQGSPEVSAAEDEPHRGPDLAPDFDEDAVLGRNRGLHVGAFLVVLVAAIAGGTTAYMFVRRDSGKDAPTTSASASASAKAVSAPTNAVAPSTLAVAPETSSATAKAASTSAKSKSGSSGVVGANPGAAPEGPDGPALAKGDLTAGEIKGVVDRNQPLIRRRCWQPEVSARQGMGGGARVQASFTISPSGSVSSASASGAEEDYPGLSSCIAARIREWKFPPSASATPVNVPFVFAAQ